jgi:carotenoid cleavage dioxygenase
MITLTYESFLTDHLAPLHSESDSLPLEVEGKIPSELMEGIYYKIGPSQRFIPYGYHHLTDGDGMIHAFRFLQDKIFYSNRWINTQCYELESRAKRSLFGSFLFPLEGDRSVRAIKPEKRSKANTNVVYHGERLLALEESGYPYVLDPISLKTKQALTSVNGRELHNITAHPKLDQDSGELHCINWHVLESEPNCTYTVFSKNGDIKLVHSINLPYRCVIHDFAITKDYIIIPIFPLLVDFDCVLKKKEKSLLHWYSDKGAYIGIMKKDPPFELTWFTIEPCYSLHTSNAYQRGHQIVLDLVLHNKPPVFNEMMNTTALNEKAQLIRFVFDLEKNCINKIALDSDDVYYNFPRIDDRLIGKGYDKTYACGIRGQHKNLLLESDALISFCHKTNTSSFYYPGSHYFTSEIVFVARGKDNYLLSLLYNKLTNKSELFIFIASTMLDGPIAIAKILHRIPYTFHGNWYDEKNFTSILIDKY